HAPLELAALLAEQTRICPLKAEDRLLVVADHEDRALTRRARAMTGEEFRGQLLDHAPLLGTGILRLVDQHVIDPAVELVEYPRRASVAQHLSGLVDEVG